MARIIETIKVGYRKVYSLGLTPKTTAIFALTLTILLTTVGVAYTEEGERTFDTDDLIYAEKLYDKTTIWTANLDNPDDKREIYRFTHASGWDGRFTLSPNHKKVAFISVLEATPRSILRTALYVINVDGTDVQKLDEGVNLYVPPFWDVNSAIIVHQKEILSETSAHIAVYSIRSDGTNKKLLFEKDALNVIPLGWIKDGSALIYYQITADSKDLYAFNWKTKQDSLIKHFEGVFPEDFHLSPDRKKVIYKERLEKEFAEQRIKVFVLDEATETTIYKADTNIFNPIWSEDGKEALFVTGSKEKERARLKAMDVNTQKFRELPQSKKGIDIPISKSPDGRFLIVRNHTDVSDYLIIIKEGDFSRHEIKSDGYVQFVGWLRR